jgi:hypothetical protein
MLQPWHQAGMQLEAGRMGTPYQTEGSPGLMGTVLGAGSKMFGLGLGGGIVEEIFS